MPARDVKLVGFGVARQHQDLEPIEQRGGEPVDAVGGADEHDPREIERDGQVIVDERAIFCGIEHLEQRSRGIPLMRVSQFVDLVEQANRVRHLGASHRLDDAPGIAPT